MHFERHLHTGHHDTKHALSAAYEVVVIISLHSTPEGDKLSQENEHFQENLHLKGPLTCLNYF